MSESKQKPKSKNNERETTGGAYAANRKNLRPLSSSEPEGRDKLMELKENQRVIHDKFGRGVVVSVSGEGSNSKATIRFEKAGEKTLLMKFARLRKLG